MPSKRHDMTEVDNGEYFFGEEGGRGTPASSYFRKISSLSNSRRSSSSSVPKVGGLAIPDVGQQVGAGRSHAEQHLLAQQELQLQAKKSKSKKKQLQQLEKQSRAGTPPSSQVPSSSSVASAGPPNDGNSSYFDLDDDWDDEFDTSSISSSIRPRTAPKEPKEEPIGRSEIAAIAERDELNSQVSRILKFQNALSSDTVDLDQLRNLAWSGVPADLRPRTWMHLLGYLPPTAERRHRTLQRKRAEYLQGVKQVFETSESLDHAMWHQIMIDIPRTNPHIKLYSFPATQGSLERILYLWAIRHPASGYVQGINDLVTPFYQTFLSEYVGTKRVEDLDPAELTKEQLDCVEADSYWCLSKLLDGIQDNYIHAQPGIHRQVAMLEKLTEKIDADLVRHFRSEGIEFMQFSFRWMNCLLMREVPMNCTIRIWDTYLSEGSQGFSDFHVYLCAAFLSKWSNELKKMNFQDLIMFLQSPPTQNWTEKDIELVLSSAFMYQTLFKDALK